MDPCICGSPLVCSKCREIPSDCKCEKDIGIEEISLNQRLPSPARSVEGTLTEPRD